MKNYLITIISNDQRFRRSFLFTVNGFHEEPYAIEQTSRYLVIMVSNG